MLSLNLIKLRSILVFAAERNEGDWRGLIRTEDCKLPRSPFTLRFDSACSYGSI